MRSCQDIYLLCKYYLKVPPTTLEEIYKASDILKYKGLSNSYCYTVHRRVHQHNHKTEDFRLMLNVTLEKDNLNFQN